MQETIDSFFDNCAPEEQGDIDGLCHKIADRMENFASKYPDVEYQFDYFGESKYNML